MHQEGAQGGGGGAPDLEQQASLLGESYCKSLNAESASFLEKDAFSEDTLVQLATEKPRLEQNLQISEQRLGLELCRLKKPCKHAAKGGKKGCPSVIILASSAKRALELLRELPHYGQACRIHKLFSKHMKVEEQVAVLRYHVCIAVGTPNRVQKLADMEALNMSHLQLILLDMQPDAKQKTLLTLPEVRDDFWSLYRAHLRGRVQAGELKFAMVGFR
uniref:Protein CMSS1 n=1 Tax=Pyramimonas obovata TaxID=1411642 RepID=A0A7S0WSV5_9CHLO|mmetsp:Transcript_38420/g.83581  ORF Transcript_38420/g.83581 Transcript_38420/m.83581 type:complete len:218 (+) Transcript_38420:447-1100(+)